MKTSSHRFSITFAALLSICATAGAQTYVDLVNLTFTSNAGDIAAHPQVSNITPWTNGSELYPDPFNSGIYVMPNDDFGNGYAGLTMPGPRFGFQWGFEGSFDLASEFEVSAISFDYNVLGHNGEASLALALGSWNSSAPLPSTDQGHQGPIFSPVGVAEQASGTVTFNFVTDTLTVTRVGYADYTTAFTDSLTLSSGTHSIDMLVSNTDQSFDGYWDVNAASTLGADGYYRIDNFRVSAAPVPEPSSLLLLGSSFALLLTRRRRSSLV
jgi:hypothetical protein